MKVRTPYKFWFPKYNKYCDFNDVDKLILKTCDLLKISDIYPVINWEFSSRLRDTLGQAEYWTENNEKKWNLKFNARHWIPIGEYARKNVIVHEVCHLAVERLFGHCHRTTETQERVLSHGSQWKSLMAKCKQNPDLEIHVGLEIFNIG